MSHVSDSVSVFLLPAFQGISALKVKTGIPLRRPHTDWLWALFLTTHFSFLSVSSDLLSLPLPALAGQTTLLLLHHPTLTTSPNRPTPCSQKPTLATPSGEVPVVYSCGLALWDPMSIMTWPVLAIPHASPQWA